MAEELTPRRIDAFKRTVRFEGEDVEIWETNNLQTNLALRLSDNRVRSFSQERLEISGAVGILDAFLAEDSKLAERTRTVLNQLNAIKAATLLSPTDEAPLFALEAWRVQYIASNTMPVLMSRVYDELRGGLLEAGIAPVEITR